MALVSYVPKTPTQHKTTKENATPYNHLNRVIEPLCIALGVAHLKDNAARTSAAVCV